MPMSIDLFWSFRSPYCYLALDRILELTRTYDVEVNVRPSTRWRSAALSSSRVSTRTTAGIICSTAGA